MEESHIVRILSAEPVTHDVKRFKVEKPQGYSFIPGQATEVTINQDGWKDKRNPFTFTSLNDWDHLEFTIKIYQDHEEGVTRKLGALKAGDELILHDVWGAIHYKGEGAFMAGGAGVTPFIAIFRQLHREGRVGANKLYFSNKTEKDIILKEEFTKILGDNFINTITDDQASAYSHDRIDEAFLKKHITDFNQNFYICGPDPMVQGIQQALKNLGAGESVITVEL